MPEAIIESATDAKNESTHVRPPQRLSVQQYQQLSTKDCQKYIDAFYGESGEHKIYARISCINEKCLILMAKYFLCPDGRAIDFAPFEKEDYRKVGMGRKILDGSGYKSFFDFAREKDIHEGDWLVCNLYLVETDRELNKGNYFTTSINSIDTNVDVLGTYCQDYGKINLYLKQDKEGNTQLNESIVMGCLRKALKAQVEEISKKTQEMEMLKVEQEALTKEVSHERQQKMDQLDQEISMQRQKLQDEMHRELAELRKKIATERGTLAFLESYHVSIDTLFEPISTDDDDPGNRYDAVRFQEAISYLQNRLHNEYHLDYAEEILSDIYLGLETRQLLLLVGRPGTGKTSLVRYLAEAFGFADAAIIPVQSNWSDKGDLIGYYNPLEKTYTATPFLDKLIEFCRAARQHPEKLYFICLDEMNLAHVEHYFAEFLSVLQERNPKKRILRLYSSSLRMDMDRELRLNSFLDDDGHPTVTYDKDSLSGISAGDRKYFLELCRQACMFVRYPDTLEIPNNVKFFGTLNQDETTLDLSPKVLDRSYIVRLERQPQLGNSDVDTRLPLQYKSLTEYEITAGDDCIISSKEIMEQMDKVVDGGLSRRVTDIMQSDHLLAWEKAIGSSKVWDCLLASLVLPRIRYGKRTDSRWNTHIDSLKGLCRDFPLSKGIFQAIMSTDEDELDFWRV